MEIEILDTEMFMFDAMHRSIVRKWIGVCISIDHLCKQAQVSHNGVVSDKKGPQTAPNMGGKYEGEMTSQPTEFTILIARYSLDKNILIGDIVGMNVWNRTLTNEELSSYTNCSAPVKARGNLVNEDTVFEYTSELIEDIEVPFDNLACSRRNTMANVFIPFIVTKRKDALNTCRKFGANTIGGELREEKEFREFYDLAHPNSAFEENC